MSQACHQVTKAFMNGSNEVNQSRQWEDGHTLALSLANFIPLTQQMTTPQAIAVRHESHKSHLSSFD